MCETSCYLGRPCAGLHKARSRVPRIAAGHSRAVLAQYVIDEIHFPVESDEFTSLGEVFLWRDREGASSRVAVNFFPHVNRGLALERIGDTPSSHLHRGARA
jgi:hypothetical protein